MSLHTEEVIRCTKCAYVYYLTSSIGRPRDLSVRVYTNGAGETFPLLTRRGWCEECNTVTVHEHIPDANEIDTFVDDISDDLKSFEMGELKWYGQSRAEFAQLVITNHSSWHQWRTTRTRGRCLACASKHVIKIDAEILAECKANLPFAHPGCGGSLIFDTAEDELPIIHAFYGRSNSRDLITYTTYSYGGLPIGDLLEKKKEQLEAKYPGLLNELRALINKIAASETMSGIELSSPLIPDRLMQSEFAKAVVEFIRGEFNDQPPDPRDGTSIQKTFAEIHQLSALLIRDIIEKLPASQRIRTTPPPPQLRPSEEVTTSIHKNPFHTLGVTTRDSRHRIVEQAEDRSLHIDHDLCQKARSDLTNPRSRLSAEMAWIPGVAPRIAERLTRALTEDPLSVRSEDGLPDLARANVMAATFELMTDNEPAESIAELIHDFGWLVEYIDAAEVLRDINEDRAISGFPEIKGVEIIEEELAERRKAYRATLKSLLDMMEPAKLVKTMTDTVALATDDGENQGPVLIDDLVDTYEIETQGFLQKEYENIAKLVESTRNAGQHGETAVAPLVESLGKVARNWDRVAQPIQLSAKSRGIAHPQSREIAFKLRSLGIDLNNEYGMLEQAHRMTELLQELFAELPEVVEKLGEDAETIAGLRRQAQEREENRAQWERDITYRTEFGVLFKDELSISPEGLSWKGAHYPLESITRVRWGSVRHSVNGIPTGTTYTIGFGDMHSERGVELRDEATYTRFLDALWRAVCARLLFSIIEQLKNGQSMAFGDMTIEDGAVTLTKHKLLGSNERVRLSWHEVSIWSADGSFVIGKRDDKKTYGSSSYINNWNTHLLEHIIRGGFKKGVSKLSDYLRD